MKIVIVYVIVYRNVFIIADLKDYLFKYKKESTIFIDSQVNINKLRRFTYLFGNAQLDQLVVKDIGQFSVTHKVLKSFSNLLLFQQEVNLAVPYIVQRKRNNLAAVQPLKRPLY